MLLLRPLQRTLISPLLIHSTSKRFTYTTMAAQDPYTAKASTNAPLETKISEVKEILGKVSTAMLTTRTTDGALHSRASRRNFSL